MGKILTPQAFIFIFIWSQCLKKVKITVLPHLDSKQSLQ